MNDAIGNVLEEMGLAWGRRESDIVVPASARVPCEVLVSGHGDKVVVRVILVAWDELGASEASALAHFLRRAEACLRSVSLRLEANGAVAEARVGEADLTDAIGGVLAAARLLSREAALLLKPEVARAYETFQRNGSEIVAASERI